MKEQTMAQYFRDKIAKEKDKAIQLILRSIKNHPFGYFCIENIQVQKEKWSFYCVKQKDAVVVRPILALPLPDGKVIEIKYPETDWKQCYRRWDTEFKEFLYREILKNDEE